MALSSAATERFARLSGDHCRQIMWEDSFSKGYSQRDRKVTTYAEISNGTTRHLPVLFIVNADGETLVAIESARVL